MFGLFDNGKYFEAYLADGKKYMFDLSKKCIVKTACTANHGDWKTNIVHLRASIPINTELELVGHFFNCYGHYLIVKYNDTTYDILQNELNYVRIEDN